MGLDNLDQFQKNFSEIMAEINHRETNSPAPDQTIKEEEEEAPPLLDPETDPNIIHVFEESLKIKEKNVPKNKGKKGGKNKGKKKKKNLLFRTMFFGRSHFLR